MYGETATATAKLADVNRNTVHLYYQEARKKILEETLKEAPAENGDFELDERCFGAERIDGKRGRGSAGKTPVFGLLKRGRKDFGEY
jgi:transposase